MIDLTAATPPASSPPLGSEWNPILVDVPIPLTNTTATSTEDRLIKQEPQDLGGGDPHQSDGIPSGRQASGLHQEGGADELLLDLEETVRNLKDAQIVFVSSFEESIYRLKASLTK